MKQKYSIKKSTAIFAAAVLGISAAPVSVWAEDDFKQQAKDSLSQFAKDFASSYEKSMSEMNKNKDSFGVKMDMGLSIDPSVAPMLSSMTGVDMSWLSKISLIMDEKFQGNTLGIKYDVQLNDTEICPFNVYFDTSAGDSYISVPTIFDGYLYAGADTLTEDMENAAKAEGLPSEAFSAFTEGFSMAEYINSLPKSADIEDLLNRYGSILIDGADETETVEETLYTHSVEQSCTRYTGYYAASTVNAIGKDLAAAAREDTQLKEILDSLNSFFPSEESLYDSLIAALEASGGDDVPADEEGFLTFSIWKDEAGRTAGAEISVLGGEEDSVASFTYQNPRQDDSSGLSISICDGTDFFIFAGSGTITDGKLNGSYSLTSNDTPLFNVNVTDYDTEAAKSGSIIGKYEFLPAEGLAAGTGEEAASMLSQFSLAADVNAQSHNQSYSLELVSNDVALAALDINLASSSDLEIPDLSTLENVYDINDEADMNEADTTVSIDPILENLIKAGVPEELIMSFLLSDTEGEEYTEDPGAEASSPQQLPADAEAA